MSFTKYLDQASKREKSQEQSLAKHHPRDGQHPPHDDGPDCASNGVTDLMVVHDSFATTIGNAQRMSLAIREAFVELYDGYCLYSDVLEQVKAQHSDPDSVEWPEIKATATKAALASI